MFTYIFIYMYSHINVERIEEAFSSNFNKMLLALLALPPLSTSVLFQNSFAQWNPFHLVHEPNLEKMVKWELGRKVKQQSYSDYYTRKWKV